MDFSTILTHEVYRNSWTHLKEIRNTSLLVSLHHCWNTSANLEIFDIVQEGKARKIYSFEEVLGGDEITSLEI